MHVALWRQQLLKQRPLVVVESRVASLAAQAEASTAHAASALSEHVKEVAVHMKEQTLCIAGNVAHQLKKEIETVAASTAMTGECEGPR